MKIIIAGNKELQLKQLECSVKAVIRDAEITVFRGARDLIEFAMSPNFDADIAFLETQIGRISGIGIAQKLQAANPKINIIFVSDCFDCAPEAFLLHASGYIIKPVTEDKIRAEYENLRHPVQNKTVEKKLKVKCFGVFEVLINDEPLKFKREKTKELFACLIDKNGAVMTPREICAVLWEEDKLDYLRQLTKDLRETLKSVGAEEIFIAHFKEYRIVPELLECDYFDYIINKPYAVKAFKGEYMSQYSWAEETLATLTQSGGGIKNRL